MKNYKSQYVTADKLMIDDHIKFGGLLYRIRKLTQNAFHEMIIEVYPLEVNTKHGSQLIVPLSTGLKIYNQK